MIFSSYKNKNVLILGGAGFIGSHLTKELVELGAKVTVIDGLLEFTGGKIENIEYTLPEIRFYKKKLEEIKDINELLKKQDLIIDSMALTSHNLGMENPLYDAHLNLLCHVYLISLLKNCHNTKIIYLGARGQYGNVKTDMITEITPQRPIDVQGINKMAAEYYYKIYSKKYGFSVVSLRITNCFGENQKVEGEDIGLIGSFIKDLLSDKEIEVYGNENRKKNIIYVKDLVNIILEISAGKIEGFNAYNVAGYEVTMKELLDTLIRIIEKGRYVIKPFPNTIKNTDVGSCKFSDAKLRNKLKSLKLINNETALKNTVDYFRKKTRGVVE